MFCCSSGMVSSVCLFKQKTAYELRISDWSSDVCSSDLPLQQPSEHAPVGLAREELVAIDKIQQRHRFAPKRMDDMAIIDDMAMFAAALGAAARKRKER